MAFVFFGVKYNIDKYNLMHLYPGEFESVCSFTRRVAIISRVTIFTFQTFMFLLFITVFGDDFYIAAGVTFGIEIFMLTLQCIDFNYFFAKFDLDKTHYNDYENDDDADTQSNNSLSM